MGSASRILISYIIEKLVVYFGSGVSGMLMHDAPEVPLVIGL